MSCNQNVIFVVDFDRTEEKDENDGGGGGGCV